MNKYYNIVSVFTVLSSLLFCDWCENQETGWYIQDDGWSGGQCFVLIFNVEFVDSNYEEPVGSGGICYSPEQNDCLDNPFTCDVVGIFTDEDEMIGWSYYGGCYNCEVEIWIPNSSSPENTYIKYYQSSSNTYFNGVDSIGNLLTLPEI